LAVVRDMATTPGRLVNPLNMDAAGQFLTFTLPYVLLSFAYFVYFEGKYGMSLGKRHVGLKVLRENGAALGYYGAFMRTLTFDVFTSSATMKLAAVLQLASGLMVVAGKKRKALHDLVCGTVVVSKKLPRIHRLHNKAILSMAGFSAAAVLANKYAPGFADKRDELVFLVVALTCLVVARAVKRDAAKIFWYGLFLALAALLFVFVLTRLG
ncbi:MAG TPA: RDD family protein, partial [Elusimicrobiota bacterium]|nr:RDD family protein [Elusimicrobiota bacterium]